MQVSIDSSDSQPSRPVVMDPRKFRKVRWNLSRPETLQTADSWIECTHDRAHFPGEIVVLVRETVHIIDENVSRRASMTRSVLSIGYHAELYEGLEEFSSRPPSSGIIMAYDKGTGSIVPDVLGTMSNSRRHAPRAVYSSDIKIERIVEVMLAGAIDYLAWPLTSQTLRKSLGNIGRISEATLERRRKEAAARILVDQLTPRENNVLAALIDGASSKDMAAMFGLSLRTVEVHRASMMKKLGARSAADAARIGLFAGVMR